MQVLMTQTYFFWKDFLCVYGNASLLVPVHCIIFWLPILASKIVEMFNKSLKNMLKELWKFDSVLTNPLLS